MTETNNNPEYVYALVVGSEWEDVTFLLIDEETAIQQSIEHPLHRIEIYKKASFGSSKYVPTYNYYKNGKYYKYGMIIEKC